MGSNFYNTELSNIVLMFYRNICILFVFVLIFMIGIGARDALVPKALVGPLQKSFVAAKDAATAATAVAAKAATATANAAKAATAATAATATAAKGP